MPPVELWLGPVVAASAITALIGLVGIAIQRIRPKGTQRQEAVETIAAVVDRLEKENARLAAAGVEAREERDKAKRERDDAVNANGALRLRLTIAWSYIEVLRRDILNRVEPPPREYPEGLFDDRD